MKHPGITAALGPALLFGAGTPFAKVLLGETSPWLLAGTANRSPAEFRGRASPENRRDIATVSSSYRLGQINQICAGRNSITEAKFGLPVPIA